MDKEAIYTEYSEKIKNYVRFKVNSPEDAEDICSNVFVKVMEKFDTFDSQKASLSTWIYTIARNTIIDFYRTRREFAIVDDEEGEDLLGSTQSPEDDYLNAENLSSLADALNKLSELERAVIVHRYYYDMRQNEIAEKLNISLPYVKLLQKKALEQLKGLIDY